MMVRISISWNTFSSRMPSRPATTTISIKASQPAIHVAANGLEGVRSIYGKGCTARDDAARYRRERADLQRANLLASDARSGKFAVGAAGRTVLRIGCLRRTCPRKDSSQEGFAHAHPTTGRMVETPR